VVCILLSAPLLQAQSYHGPGYINMRNEIIDGDSTVFVDIIPIYIFNKPADMRKYAKLVRNVKKVYPIAKEAKAKLANMEAALMTINGKKAQKAYIKKMEKEIKKQYTPVLKNMTFAQGKVLIKLIDRETDKTSYAIVKELRGGFSAVFWQGIARIFGANLKDTYDKKGEDKVIEQIILMYEAGLI
jgi:hypothetical protein